MRAHHRCHHRRRPSTPRPTPEGAFPVFVTVAALLAVYEAVDVETVKNWTDQQRRRAYEWAVSVRLEEAGQLTAGERPAFVQEAVIRR